jgi:hypothetical protein
LITSSDGPLVVKEDCDSKSSMSIEGSLAAKAALEACRRPLPSVERSIIRASLIASRPSADEASRRAMAACVDAVLILIFLHIDIEIVGRKKVSEEASLPHRSASWPLEDCHPNQQSAEIHTRTTHAEYGAD